MPELLVSPTVKTDTELLNMGESILREYSRSLERNYRG